jgi:hypothetical protein
MRFFRGSPFIRFVMLLALVSFLSACHKWVPLEPPVAQALAEEEPGTARVTLANGRQIVFKEPRVSGDSLTGLVEQPSYIERGKIKRDTQPISILLDDVRSIEERRTNVPATVGATLGISLLVLTVIGAAVFAAECSGDGGILC